MGLDRGLYSSPRVAAGYAHGRPAVHPRILQRVRESLHLIAPLGRALDIGCGAGRSTAALDDMAHHVVGMDPAAAMMAHRQDVAPRAQFVVGQAERLPFSDAAFDLITAAGAINYANLDLAIPEIARVLAATGTLVVYDFSAGRRLRDGRELEKWYVEFDRRYPDAPGYSLDVTRLPFDRAGLGLDNYQVFEIAIPMTLDAYLRYAMSETRIELALSAGAREADVGEWCRRTLQEVFGDQTKDVVFDAYAAYVSRSAQGC
jgi:SAM-dependent methyltransferase